MTERFNKTSTFSFNFWVITAYEDPATKAQTFDRAPNSGTWTYEARITTDVDGDGLRPPADKCPTVAGGRYDSNRNGCPGPFPLIKPHFSGQVVAEGRRTKVSLLTVDNLPPGARVVLTGARKRVSLVANGAGEVATAGFRSKVFPARNLIEARITKPGWVGYYGVLSPRTLRPVVKQCIPATGSQTPVPCSAALRGR
jgi:hypothetical protein